MVVVVGRPGSQWQPCSSVLAFMPLLLLRPLDQWLPVARHQPSCREEAGTAARTVPSPASPSSPPDFCRPVQEYANILTSFLSMFEHQARGARAASNDAGFCG